MRWSLVLLGLLAGCATSKTPRAPREEPTPHWVGPTLFVSPRQAGNQYSYAVTRTASPRPPAPDVAAPILHAGGDALVEIGIINVKADFGGWGPGGLAQTEGELYRDLGIVAAGLGGSHFQVVKTGVTQIYVTSAVVSVLAPRDAPRPADSQTNTL